jgi:hypothetical protein
VEEALGLKEEALVATLGDAVEAAVGDSINQSFTGRHTEHQPGRLVPSLGDDKLGATPGRCTGAGAGR